MQEQKQRIQLSDHFNYKKLFLFVLSPIAMAVFTSIYGVVDGFFVSNFVGKTAFASLNLIMPYIMILGGMGFMVGTGGSALVGKILGQGDRERANKIFSIMIWFTVIFGAVLTVIGVTTIRPIAKLLGATEDMIDDCTIYGRIVLGFCIPFMLQNVFQAFCITAEKPKLGFLIILCAGVANMILDALFVGVFKWGLVGAAVATGIGQCIGGIIPLVYFCLPNNSLLRMQKAKLEIRPILQACANGSSELMSNIACSVVGIVFNFVLMKYYGENGISAYGVLMYVQFIFISIYIGYAIGTAPIISFNYGALNHIELKNVFKKSIIIMGIAGVVLTGLAEALAYPLAKIFVGYDEELCELTVSAFRIVSFVFLTAGINIFTSSFFTALNNGGVSALISFLRTLVFQTSFVMWLPLVVGKTGIWWSIIIGEFCAFLVSLLFLLLKRKKYHY